MRIEVLAMDGASGASDADAVLSVLEASGVDHGRVATAGEAKGDVLAVVGDSAFLLQAVRELPPHAAVLAVGAPGPGVLAEISASQMESAVEALQAGHYRVESVDRMRVQAGDSAPVLALNEAALLPATGGQFVRYALWVDGELLWRDRGDGVIVATPTGSTAHALSAGGPVVLAGTPAFSVAPICSVEGNRPLVASNDSVFTLTDAASPGGVDLVVDGRVRVRLGRDEDVTVRWAEEPARFVRLSGPRFGRLLGRLKLERELGHELKDAPPSAKFIYKLLEYEGPLTQQEMAKQSQLASRTVRNALSHLTQKGVVAKAPNLRDARQDVYDLTERVSGR